MIDIDDLIYKEGTCSCGCHSGGHVFNAEDMKVLSSFGEHIKLKVHCWHCEKDFIIDNIRITDGDLEE